MNFSQQAEPTVSVLMPVYNAEKYLKEAVESILAQTFTDFEFIIVNDGSTDSSAAILQKYQQQDNRIQIITQKNAGVTAAANKALSYAQGDYIARMDSDDIALPQKLEKQVAFLAHNLDIVALGTQVLLIDSEGWPICPFSQQTNHEEIDQAHLAVKGGAICNPTVIIRHDVIKTIGGYRSQFEPAEDFDLFLRLAEVGKLANLPDVLLKYRMHLKSLGNSGRIKQFLGAKKAVIEAYQRRGLVPPTTWSVGDEYQATASEQHYKWAWWALNAGNVATARKQATLAWKKQPISLKNWKLIAYTIRGY